MVFFVESLKNRRSNNEDSYCHMELRVNHEAKVNAFCIADGMGGLDAGKDYSQKAVSLWFEELVHTIMGEQFINCSLKTQIDTLRNFSGDVMTKINEILYKAGMDTGKVGGTTLTTVIHFWDSWIIANCGDSPVYIVRNQNLELISEIQNVAWQMVREKKTQVGSTLFYQNKNRLLQYLGRRDCVKPYVRILDDRQIQAVLLGSDGAFGDLSMNKMENILLQFPRQSKALSLLLEYAREQGENDNQTAFLIVPPEKEEHFEEAEDLVEEGFLCKEGENYVAVEEPSFSKRLKSYFSKAPKGGKES
ncbi:MAG: protein phosphatase 2C domain-containing protein [Eubacteriales bacterium]|nr:protein phosphatase 2C domain-containing protein [Eubacteriales bacterium]